MKKAIAIPVVIVLFLALAISAVASTGTVNKDITYRNIQITLDGKALAPKDVNGAPTEPFIMDGSTYLPVRAVAEALGVDVGWDDGASTVTLSSAAAAAPLNASWAEGSAVSKSIVDYVSKVIRLLNTLSYRS